MLDMDKFKEECKQIAREDGCLWAMTTEELHRIKLRLMAIHSLPEVTNVGFDNVMLVLSFDDMTVFAEVGCLTEDEIFEFVKFISLGVADGYDAQELEKKIGSYRADNLFDILARENKVKFFLVQD
jgi:hypothetical protein